MGRKLETTRPPEPRTSLRPWIISGAIAFVTVLLCLITLVFPALRTPQQLAADAAPPPPSPITAKAQKRPLNASIVMRAVVAPGASVDLKPSDALIAANQVVTGLPAAGASAIQPGTVPFEANGEPIIAMNWPFPAYRDIRAGDRGPDVAQLQKTLASLGYRTGSAGLFDVATQFAVAKLYADLGYTAPQATAAAAGPTNGGAKTEQPTSNQDQSQSTYLPARNVQAIPAMRSRITSIPLQVGQKIDRPDLVLAKLDGKTSTVIATTTPDRAARIAPGNTGTLSVGLPAQHYEVRVTAVAQATGDVPGLGQGMRVDLEFIDPAKPAPVSPTGTTAKLEITTGNGDSAGLALPITAIYSSQDGTSYVIPASQPDARIGVDLGAEADGWVEIKPTGELKEGEDVILGMQPKL